MTLKFDDIDSGNCRAYYLDGRKVYCIQDETSWGRPAFKFYCLLSDHEPLTRSPIRSPISNRRHYGRAIRPEALALLMEATR